ncbi:GntR family transcriptional regulator [Primorskyibacter sp. S187A]|uniref:GntR family transcriptional regulator n=1 Tax=Primorskyibacter sp. S187A TaxID=3415130 RepID=UPI003C798DAC
MSAEAHTQLTEGHKVSDVPTLPERIKAQIVGQILSGTLAPGDRLVELRIAKDMGTSQAPVREAIRDLEALGLVETRRNRGAVIRRITPEELIDLYAVRAQLEGFAAELTATHAPQTASALARLCDEMEAARGNPQAFVSLNTRFHRTIIEASGNAPLLKIWERLDIQITTAVNRAARTEGLEAALADHRAITAAIAQGDARAARRAIQAHVNRVVL